MLSAKNQVLFVSEGKKMVPLCFVCGQELKEDSRKIVETKTQCQGIPLPNKLSNLIGDDFYVVVSMIDEVCDSCIKLIDKVDKLEENLTELKQKIVKMLQVKYEINIQETPTSEQDCIVINSSSDGQLTGVTESQENTNNDNYLIESCNLEENCTDSNREIGHITETKVPSKKYCSDTDYKLHVQKNHCLDGVINSDFTSFAINEANEILYDGKYEFSNQFYSEPGGILDPSIKVELVCGHCTKTFKTEDDLHQHIESEHNNGSSETTAAKDTNEYNDSQIDVSETQNTTTYNCMKCGFTNEDKEVVKKHLEYHFVSKKPVVCDICEMPFPTTSVLNRHFKVHAKSEGPVICNICGKQCHDSLHANYHRKNEHNLLQEISCGLCNMPMDSNVELKNHMLMMHRGKKEYKCKECNKIFTRHVQYENHKLYAHGNSQCRICGKYISDAVKLRQHEHRHARTDMNKFECEVCKRTFKTAGGLRVHSVSHTGKYKLFCEFCGRGFMSSVILEEHKGVHTKEERYVCDTCGRKFVLYSTFHLHRQWHKNPYPFPCRVCDRKFRYRSERSNHMRRVHTGEMPHKCPYCDAAFIKSSYLKKHITSHTKMYPFNCETCKKGFDQKRTLARHMSKVHADNSLLLSMPKPCQYKVALRPEEYPEEVDTS